MSIQSYFTCPDHSSLGVLPPPGSLSSVQTLGRADTRTTSSYRQLVVSTQDLQSVMAQLLTPQDSQPTENTGNLTHTPPSQQVTISSPGADPIPYRLVQRIRSGEFIEMRDLLADNIALHSQLEALHGQINDIFSHSSSIPSQAARGPVPKLLDLLLLHVHRTTLQPNMPYGNAAASATIVRLSEERGSSTTAPPAAARDNPRHLCLLEPGQLCFPWFMHIQTYLCCLPAGPSRHRVSRCPRGVALPPNSTGPPKGIFHLYPTTPVISWYYEISVTYYGNCFFLFLFSSPFLVVVVLFLSATQARVQRHACMRGFFFLFFFLPSEAQTPAALQG